MIDLGGPLRLAPVMIPKPWGQEIWFTGIEARGQSEVAGEGGRMSLHWLLSIAERDICGAARASLNLLKILDPLPDPVYGDLYFELHRQKSEVYVVTGVHPDSWPEGRGAIRFGLAPDARREHATDSDFRAAYLADVRTYQGIRRAIDAVQDGWRCTEGFEPNAPVPAATLRRWHAALAPELRLREAYAREAMERHTHLAPLCVGDVVQIPPLLPHALQHGVRTVEFQTPVYERKILSFGQKVLTQDHWDTEEVIAEMRLDAPLTGDIVVLAETSTLRHERIATFPDFAVERLRMAPASEWGMETAGVYALVMVVAGIVSAGDKTLEPETAVLVPACRPRCGFRNTGAEDATLLISRPLNGAVDARGGKGDACPDG
ncbi:MAG: hypothetical protein AB7I68_08955 [Porticoccaceae bacterium]